MQDHFAISMPLHPFVAAVIRTQFSAVELAEFATSEGRDTVPAEEQSVIDGFLSGLCTDRLELNGPHSSLVASSLIAHLLDFCTPDELAPYLEDLKTFGTPADRAEWEGMTEVQRLAFFEGAKAVGDRACEAWGDLTRDDD